MLVVACAPRNTGCADPPPNPERLPRFRRVRSLNVRARHGRGKGRAIVHGEQRKPAAHQGLHPFPQGGQRVAFVADEDAKALLTLDLESRTQLAETMDRLEKKQSQRLPT